MIHLRANDLPALAPFARFLFSDTHLAMVWDATRDECERDALGQFAAEGHETQPERLVAQDQAWQAVRHVIDNDLTARQREALLAVVVDGWPVTEVAGKLGTTHNAFHKLMFDARRRVRRVLSGYGWSATEMLDLFERPLVPTR